jgi:hypothetical protein
MIVLFGAGAHEYLLVACSTSGPQVRVRGPVEVQAAAKGCRSPMVWKRASTRPRCRVACGSGAGSRGREEPHVAWHAGFEVGPETRVSNDRHAGCLRLGTRSPGAVKCSSEAQRLLGREP